MTHSRKAGYGHFGILGRKYDEVRQGVPIELIDYFWDNISRRNPTILDVGCGTGISTRQLSRSVGESLYGLDIDEDMVKIAQTKRVPAVDYVCAAANKMPFGNENFDAMTAFSAFHWFCDRATIDEIKRVLKMDGIFFVVNKNDAGDFKEGYRAVLKDFIPAELPDAKKSYKPFNILQTNGFLNVREETFETTELFTIQGAVNYFQTVSLWNLVPMDKRSQAVMALEKYCAQRSLHGLVERPLNVVTVVGTKPCVMS